MTDIHAFSNEVYSTRDTMRGIANDLARLAAAFHETGNAKVAERLFDAVNGLDEQAKRLMDAHGQKVFDDLHASEQATATMLLGVLGGMKLGGKVAPETEGVMLGLAEMTSPGITKDIAIREVG